VNDLTADLTADLSAELAAPRAVPAPAPAPAPVRRPVPAVSVVFTPLHWARPSVASPSAGSGVVLRGGPWQVDVLL
jgi:hypothetical protein